MDEKALIKQAIEGQEEAFNQLVGENREAVFRHCMSLVHDEKSAEDLTQETFLHAYTYLKTFRAQAKFSTWLWRIAHNLSLNYLRRKKGGECELQENMLPKKEVPKQAIDPELEEQIREALKLLSEEHRTIFELYDLERIPQKEIAKRLGVPYGTVRSRLHYARRKIRKLLQEASDKN